MSRHTATFRGRRVCVVRRDGARLEGKFRERTPSGHIVLDLDSGEVSRTKLKEVRQFLLIKRPCLAR